MGPKYDLFIDSLCTAYTSGEVSMLLVILLQPSKRAVFTFLMESTLSEFNSRCNSFQY